jgi:hypothetical protein
VIIEVLIIDFLLLLLNISLEIILEEVLIHTTNLLIDNSLNIYEENIESFIIEESKDIKID